VCKSPGTTYLRGYDALVAKITTHASDKLNLLLMCQACDGGFKHLPQLDVIDGNESVVVDVGEETHDELAVHAVGDAAMAGDRIAKVLDLECALETGCEEATEWRDQRRERGQHEGVDLDGRECDGEVGVGWEEEELGELPGVRYEDGIRIAYKAGEDVGAKVLKRRMLARCYLSMLI
jgi:hypothetical protein